MDNTFTFTAAELVEMQKELAELKHIARFFAKEAQEYCEGEFSVKYIPADKLARKWYNREIKFGRISEYE